MEEGFQRRPSVPEANRGAIPTLEEVIHNASRDIEAEMMRSSNTWLSCFNTILGRLMMRVELEKIIPEGGAGPSDDPRVFCIRELSNKVRILRDQYPTRDLPVHQNVKDELFADLKEIFEEK